jgi:hypothetical protein
MHAISLLWMVERLRTVTHAFPAPLLLVVARTLRATFAIPQRGHLPARMLRAPRPGSSYTMLVASDVQHGMGGILP